MAGFSVRPSLCHSSSGARWLGRQTGPSLFDHVIDYFLQIAGLTIHTQLSICARSHLEYPMYVVDVLTRAKLVHYVLDEIEVFVDQITHRYFGLLSEVDEFPFK